MTAHRSVRRSLPSRCVMASTTSSRWRPDRLRAPLVMRAEFSALSPRTYLTDVLERIVSGRTKNHQLHELLAWNWKAAREPAERTAA